MPKYQAVWAIDIGQSALKALKLVPGETPDQVVAEAFDYVEYPKILSQPDADPEELVREAMATFLQRNDLKNSRVAIGVPGQAGLVKFIKLPPVEKKRIPDIVTFEARQQIPFALQEVIWDWQEIGSDDGDDDFAQTEVGLFAMKRDQIFRAIQPFQTAGIEVDIVQMGPIALFNFIAFDRLNKPASDEPADGSAKPNAEHAGSVVLLDIGADHTDLIITDGRRIWQRNVPIGGNHFTRALTKELKLTFAKAEHLKKNATKAPDPRAVFTAMRGVFNDFASEVNRSIGFYSSVNRQAKVTKIIGVGNGFKLPGLQKFLQQNLSHDVERLDSFQRLVGDDVVAAPQFQENTPSFAVAYGLGLQGLGLGGMQTNLLPGEISQARLIRAKKPWVLATAALLLLGFSTLFLGNYRVLAKVDNEAFAQAVEKAKSVASQGSKFESDYSSAKSQFEGIKNKGSKLVEASPEGASFIDFFRTVSDAIYDPSIDPELKHLSFDRPADREILETYRVHIDGIRPVFKSDLSAWFSSPVEMPNRTKDTMHPFDRETPPSGKGWVIEIFGHHYNPTDRTNRKSGPYFFLTERVLPRFWEIPYRQKGFSHACLRWMLTDAKWTSDKAMANNGLPTGAPTLAHSGPAKQASGGMDSGFGGGQMGTMSGQMGTMGMPGSMGAMGEDAYSEYMGQGRGGMGMEGMGMMGMMGQGGRSSAFGPQGKKEEIELKYLTRTDFVIYVVWQPPSAETKTPDAAELAKKIREAEAKFKDQIRTPNLLEFEKASEQESMNALQGISAGDAGASAPGADGSSSAGQAPGASGSSPSGSSPSP